MGREQAFPTDNTGSWHPVETPRQATLTHHGNFALAIDPPGLLHPPIQ